MPRDVSVLRRISVEFMHLDGLVDWIAKERIFNELRAALKDEDIDVSDV